MQHTREQFCYSQPARKELPQNADQEIHQIRKVEEGEQCEEISAGSCHAEVCSVDEFQETNIRWMKRLHEYGVPVAFQGLYQFPEPKMYNCGAIGRLGEKLDSSHANAVKWKEWTPLANPVCRSCEFLPSCLGGCPRNQMQMREVQKKENCQYYQQHENRILATHLELAQV